MIDREEDRRRESSRLREMIMPPKTSKERGFQEMGRVERSEKGFFT